MELADLLLLVLVKVRMEAAQELVLVLVGGVTLPTVARGPA